MKRQSSSPKIAPRTNWVQFVTLVLAFIGLGQVLAGGLNLLHRLF